MTAENIHVPQGVPHKFKALIGISKIDEQIATTIDSIFVSKDGVTLRVYDQRIDDSRDLKYSELYVDKLILPDFGVETVDDLQGKPVNLHYIGGFAGMSYKSKN